MSKIHAIGPVAVLSIALGTTPLVAQDAASRVTRLEARPAAVSLTAGESVALAVVALDARGDVMDVPVRVAVPRQAARYQDGQVTGITPGEYQIVATLVVAAGGEPISVIVPLTVRWPAVADVTLDHEPGRLYVGTTIRHWGTAMLANGSVRPDVEFAWQSSNPRVATVDLFGNVSAHEAGEVTIAASFQDVEGAVSYQVTPLPATQLTIDGGLDEVRTGDVQTFAAVARDANGNVVDDVPITWTHAYTPPGYIIAPSAPGQLDGGKFVADLPGVYTVMASAGPLSSRKSFRAVARDAVETLDVVGLGSQSRSRTTDFWVFEGLDGRDYALTGSKVADGHAFVWDVTDPSNIFKTDSIQVDARAVNDVKVSPDSRYGTMTREGASNRRNGVVILDLADPAHPRIASVYDEGLTGGVHNAFPTDDYLFALSGGDKYVIIDVRDIYNPRFVSEYNHPDSRVHDVWVHDGIAYSAEWGSGVVVVDVGNGRWGGTIENPVFVTNYPVPGGRTHAVFPYASESTDKFYLFIGDEIMSRRGLANEGSHAPGGDYARRYDPETGGGGTLLSTQGYIQVIDFTDPENPAMVARYEVTEYGTHNIWVEDDRLYQAYYEGGLRVVDVSGELMGNLYTQGREIAVYRSADPQGYVANSTMVWSAMPHKGHVFFSDTNSGLWAVKLQPKTRPVM
ncbi:MAG: Ig-like domain-containing protein [Gemmatimonadetes bacterium]|nr:Ig-like domain-containing protein [Gemmatimonadota bacterium]